MSAQRQARASPGSTATAGETPPDHERDLDVDSDPDHGEVVWQRLSSRVVWIDAVMFLLSLVPSVVVMVVLDLDFDSGSFGIWPAVITTGLGVYGSLSDLVRWMKTRYRITDERVEQRTGWMVRKYRFVPRERIRSVDTTAKLRHLVAGLRVVHIGSGEHEPSLKLDAVSTRMAARLRRDLMRSRPGPSTEPAGAATDPMSPVAEGQEIIIARLRWSWIFYNLVNVWAFLVAAFLLWSLYWLLLIVNIDLTNVMRRLVDWERLGLWWSIAVSVAAAFVIGVVGLAIFFIRDNWNFRLLRTMTDHGTALLTRQGLLQTREVYRDDRRLRGIRVSEPLFWRWIGLSETEVISTGLAGWSPGVDAASSILPRGPVAEARRVAALVLGGDVRPLEAPLRSHPRGALYRRLGWAVVTPIVTSVFLAWLGAAGAIAASRWLIPLAVLPVALLLAVVGYRSLGHALVGQYVVLRSGVSTRRTAALQRRAIIGWTIRQSLVQRWLGLMTVGVATAAGSRFYRAPDLGAAHAVAFVHETTPDLVAEFLQEPGATSGCTDVREAVGADVLRTTASVRDDPTATVHGDGTGCGACPSVVSPDGFRPLTP